MKRIENYIKLFSMTSAQLVHNELSQIEKKYDIDLGHLRTKRDAVDETYYPQFELALRKEAKEMSEHYEIFYCLEKTIRKLITDVMEEDKGAKWWNKNNVPDKIINDVQDRIKQEQEAGVTKRSDDPIDYTTFGELGHIIIKNWEVFGFLNSQKAVQRVMSMLNTLRGPIAHCSPLAEDEITRLHISVRDWFRLME